MSSSIASQLADHLSTVRQRIEAACRRAGRAASEVTLVAVTKSVTAEVAGLLPALGVVDLGESRPQELCRKAAVLPEGVRWHLIGHLQRNKIEQILPLATLIHSVDSLRLLTALEREAERQGRTVEVLLEVNASRELNKHGFTPEEVPTLTPELEKLRRVRVRGLMTMAALVDDPECSRPTFAEVRALRDRLRGEWGPPHSLDHLSMGMTNDFEQAVEAGATLVRIGSALFDLEYTS